MLNIVTTNKYQSRLAFQRALVNIAQAAADYPTNKFYQQLLDSALEAIEGAEGGSVLVRAQDDQFYYRAARGFQLEDLQTIQFSVQDMAKVHGSLQPRLRHCADGAKYFDAQRVDRLKRYGRIDDIQVTLAVPVILRNRLVMVISLDNFQRADAFDSEAVSRAEAIAAHVAALLERTQLNKQLLAQQVFQEKFRAVLARALAETDEIAFLHYVLTQTISLIPGAHAGSVFLRVHADSYHIVAAVGHKLDTAQTYAFRSAELNLSVDMETFKPSVLRNILRFNDAVLSSDSLAVLQQASEAHSISSTLVIPVVLDSELAAIAYIDNFDDEDAFDDSLELAELIAEQLSVFLQRFKYEQKLYLQTRYQKALLEILHQALTTTDDASFYDYVLAKAVDAIPSVEAGSIVRQLASGNYQYVAARGFPLDVLQTIILASPEALLDQDLSQSSYVLTREHIAERSQRYSPQKQSVLAQAMPPGQSILTTLMLPIRVANDLPAVMYLDNFHDEKAFDDEIIAMAEGFASQVTAVISRLRWQRKQDQYAYTQQLLTDIEELLLRVEDIRKFFPELTRHLLDEPRLGIVFAELFFHDYDSLANDDEKHLKRLHVEVFSSDKALIERQREVLIPTRHQPLDDGLHLTLADGNTVQLTYIEDIHNTPYPAGLTKTWYLADDVQVSSAMLIPLYQQGKLWGRYNLFFREPFALNSITKDFFYKVVSNIAVALDKQASREALERELLHMQAIVAANEALHSSFSEQNVFTQTVISAQRYVHAKTVFLIYDAEGLATSSVIPESTAAPELDQMLSRSNLLTDPKLSPENIVAVAGQHNDPLYKRGLELATKVLEQRQACRAPTADIELVALPLTTTQRRTTGVLVVAATSLNKGDSMFLEALAQACSSALTRLKLVTAREQEAAAYRALANFGATIEAINDVDTLMRLGMKRLMAQLGLEAAHTYDVHYTNVPTHSLSSGINVPNAGVSTYASSQHDARFNNARFNNARFNNASFNNASFDIASSSPDALAPTARNRVPQQRHNHSLDVATSASTKHQLYSANQQFEATSSAANQDMFSQTVTQRQREDNPQYDYHHNTPPSNTTPVKASSAQVSSAQASSAQASSAQASSAQVSSAQVSSAQVSSAKAAIAPIQLSPGEIWGRQPEGFLAKFNDDFTATEGVIREVLEQKRLRYIEIYQHYPNANKFCLELGLRTLLVIPVMQRKQVVKIICLSSYQSVQPLSEDKLTIAQSFVRRLENAIERVDDVREVEATREATLRALGLALEYRDLETKGHSERVVNLSLAVGSKLGFSTAGMQSLRWGAYLHDIGKVGVPDSILLKPGNLTPDEFEAIKKHTILGATLCSDIPFLPVDSIAIVRSHHERWDGSGYPDNLAGTDIPLMARLFSLVDVYDALSNARIYKDAWERSQVVEEIARLKGKQFDPELTDVFLEVVNEQVS